MATYKAYIYALRKCAKEHENELVPFAHIRTTDLCNDTADLLERLDMGIEKSIDEMTRLFDSTNNIDLENRTYDCIAILKRNIESCEGRE